MPVVEWFRTKEMLRTVLSVQKVEAVWEATKRVFEELASWPRNRRLVFSKPHAVDEKVKVQVYDLGQLVLQSLSDAEIPD